MRRLVLLALALSFVGCGPTSHTFDGGTDAGEPAVIPPVGASTSMMIDAAGGTIALEDLELTIPAGALSAPTEIVVSVTDVTAAAVVTSTSRPEVVIFSPTWTL